MTPNGAQGLSRFSPEPPPIGNIPEQSPDFSLPDVNGNEVSLASYSGKILILYFWGMYSQPSRDGISLLASLREAYRSQNVEIISFCLDRDLPRLRKFVREQKVAFPVLLPTKSALRAFGDINAIPTSVILNWNHHIVAHSVGFSESDFFEGWIQRLIKDRQSPAIHSVHEEKIREP